MLFAATLAVMAAPGLTRAQTLEAREENGYGRIVLKSMDLPRYEVVRSGTVLVVAFDRALEVDTSAVAAALPRYVSAGRRDPDGRAMRFGLQRAFSVNTIAAGNDLYIDLLPPDWSGPPPSLPAEVIAELSERARRVAELERQAAERAESEPAATVDFHVGRHPTFTRLSFAWSEEVEPTLARRGDTVTLAFDAPAELDLAALLVELPDAIRDVEADPGVEGAGEGEASGLTVTMDVRPDAQVRGFWDESAYIVDVMGAERSADAEDENAAAGAFTSRGRDLMGQTVAVPRAPPVTRITVDTRDLDEAGPAGSGPVSDTPPPRAGEGASAAQARPRARPAETAVEAEEALPPQEQAGEEGAQAAAPRNRVVEEEAGMHASAPRVSAEANGRSGAGAQAEAAAAMPAPGAAMREDAAGPSADALAPIDSGNSGDSGDSAGPIVARASYPGEALALDFAFEGEAPAVAALARGGRLWLAFDSEREVEKRVLGAPLPEDVTVEAAERRGGYAVLRLAFDPARMLRMTPDSGVWRVWLGEADVPAGEAVALERERGEDGAARVVFDLAQAGEPLRLRDPDTGERLVLVPAPAPVRALRRGRQHVEFDALASVQGLGFLAHIDDLAVSVDEKTVTIARPDGGLALSLEPLREMASESGTGAERRAGFIRFAGEESGDPAGAMASLLREAAGIEEPAERERQRRALARLFLAHQLAPEALGVLSALERDDPSLGGESEILAMRGAANVLMGRLEEARASLAHEALSESADAQLWLALAAAGQRDWRAASDAYARGREALSDYPPPIAARFRLAGARAAVERGALDAAAGELAVVADQALPADLDAERMLLVARAAEAEGRDEAAEEGYRRALEAGEGPIAAEARLRLTDLLLRRGDLDREGGRAALETLAMTWRGDWIETSTLKTLAGVYADDKDYRRAFEAMRMAAALDSDSAAAAALEADMARLFEDLFLDGGGEAMPAVASLALYYDFRSLTPSGRRGDEMIRRLADRLVELDLLPQAAALLEHQVENRLSGAARAEVAAKLALVQLMDGRPRKALRALSRSRQASLPRRLERERRLLEARALTESGRPELAAEIVATLDGEDAARARIEALWVGERWQEAAEALESLLGTRHQGEEALGESARHEALRAGIAYTLAGDQLGLDRLRGRYLSKMGETPDAHAFDVVTRPIEAQGTQFKQVARAIADVDMLEQFLQSYRARYFAKGEASRADAGAAAGPDAAREG